MIAEEKWEIVVNSGILLNAEINVFR